MSERPKKVPRRERLIEIDLELFSSRSYDSASNQDTILVEKFHQSYVS